MELLLPVDYVVADRFEGGEHSAKVVSCTHYGCRSYLLWRAQRQGVHPNPNPSPDPDHEPGPSPDPNLRRHLGTVLYLLRLYLRWQGGASRPDTRRLAGSRSRSQQLRGRTIGPARLQAPLHRTLALTLALTLTLNPNLSPSPHPHPSPSPNPSPNPSPSPTLALSIYLCRTVLWNGPMGVFEQPAYAQVRSE